MTDETNGPELFAGHRSRMLERFRRGGLEGFTDVQVLEFLLSFAIPRKDVNGLAHQLLREFGSLYRVFEAEPEQLERVPGIGPRSAALLACCGQLGTRCEKSRLEGELYLQNTRDLGRYLMARANGLREERAWLLSLDARCRLIECREVCRGSVNTVNLPFRRVVETAVLANATSVILAHNHTSGSILPSVEDIEYTRSLARTLELMEVTLADHFIVGSRGYLSMKASNML